LLPWRRRRRKRAPVVVGHGRKSPPVRSFPPMLVLCLLELHPILLHFLRSNNHNNNRFNPSPNFVTPLSVCLSGCLIHEPCHDQVLESGCMVSTIESQVFVCSCGARYLHTLQPSPNDLHFILSVSVSVCLSVCLSHSGDDR
jgi:hypothetical protein